MGESPDGNGGLGPQAASPETERLIDPEVKQIVADAYKVCKETPLANRDLLEELIEQETVDFIELNEMVGKYDPELAEAQKQSMPDLQIPVKAPVAAQVVPATLGGKCGPKLLHRA